MTLSDILALTKAGWTKDAVTALLKAEEERKEEPTPTPTPEPAEVPAEQPAPVIQGETETEKALREKIDSLQSQIATLQKANRSAGAEEKTESISDIIMNLF